MKEKQPRLKNKIEKILKVTVGKGNINWRNFFLGPLALESVRSGGGAETIYCGSSFFPLYRWVVSVDVRSGCSSTHQRALHILSLPTVKWQPLLSHCTVCPPHSQLAVRLPQAYSHLLQWSPLPGVCTLCAMQMSKWRNTLPVCQRGEHKSVLHLLGALEGVGFSPAWLSAFRVHSAINHTMGGSWRKWTSSGPQLRVQRAACWRQAHRL